MRYSFNSGKITKLSSCLSSLLCLIFLGEIVFSICKSFRMSWRLKGIIYWYLCTYLSNGDAFWYNYWNYFLFFHGSPILWLKLILLTSNYFYFLTKSIVIIWESNYLVFKTISSISLFSNSIGIGFSRLILILSDLVFNLFFKSIRRIDFCWFFLIF